MVDELLGDEPGDGNHGQAAVVQLLGLEVVLLLGVGGVQAQGVEAEVTGNVGVIVVQLVEARAGGVPPSDLTR
jgi:hypothetical protein